MERYLSLEIPKEEVYSSPFNDYTIGESDLLPNYFGDIAPINVFLGENNSGKSRFMREIMKRNPTRVFNLGFFETLHKTLSTALSVVNSTLEDELHEIDLTAYQSSYNNKNILDFFSITQSMFSRGGSVNLKIAPKNNLESSGKLIFEIIKNMTSQKLLLDFLADDNMEKNLKEVKEIILDLKRAQVIYKNLWDVNSHGFSADYQEQEMVRYTSSHGTLQLHTAEAVRFVSTRSYAKEFGERVSKLMDAVIDALIHVAKALNVFGGRKLVERIRTYIPALRTARTLVKPGGGYVQEDMIEATVSEDYELKSAGMLINTGLSLYAAIDGKKNSDLGDREEFKRFEEFLSETFFNGKDVQVVPNRKKTNILVAVDREERALPHLGDGIQAIILLLYPLFIAPKEAWFFIEEPEIHLHPGFQRLFIKTIATHRFLLDKNLTIFLTTHSNHLLDFALDEAKNINLFTFRKSLVESGKAKYQVHLTAPQDIECLTALGVQNSSVFLSNCTIWVEGVTDRIYLKAYLAAYLRHKGQTFSLLEGLHYSFLEYAGANVSHYTFGSKAQQVIITNEALKEIQALSISNRIMLIADQDAGKEAKHDRLTSQQHAGFEYIVLKTREIENLLTPEVIVGALQKLYPRQTFNASSLKQEQYHDIYLASYLRKKFPDLKETFVAASGTIDSSKKRKFAEAAAEVIFSWNFLSSEAKELTEQVFQFIIGHNPRLGSN